MKKARHNSIYRRGLRAFTLTEMMMAAGVSALVVLGLVSSATYLRRVSFRQSLLTSRAQNVRGSVEMLVRDIRMAGYGVNLPKSSLSAWITWVPGMTNVVVVTPGAGADDPDSISIVCAQKLANGTVQSAVFSGDTTISVPSGAAFNTSDHRLLLIGKTEVVRLLSVSGNTLTISAHPTSTNGFLRHEYPAGTSIETIKVVTYTCGEGSGTLAGRTYLTKDDHTSATASAASRLADIDVDNLKAVPSANSIQIDVTVRTSRPDPNWDDPIKHDGYKRATAHAEVTWRNQS